MYASPLATVLPGAEPEGRFEKLVAFCRENGLREEQVFYERLLSALRRE